MNAEHATKIAALLSRAGIATHEVQAYGRQLTVECLSLGAAERAAVVVSSGGFKLRGTIKTSVNAKENKGTCLLPTQRTVWRVYACLA